MDRNPAVAGQFYPASSSLLKKELKALMVTEGEKEDAIGVVSPHAGYKYSGIVAGSVLSSIVPKGIYVLLGPDHTGMGKPFSIMARGVWKMPMGDVEIDSELANEILKSTDYVEEDDSAHSYEHSIEVEIPFLQYLKKNFKIVPIIISRSTLGVYRAIGRAIGKAVERVGKGAVIIASTDLTHYEPQESAVHKDKKAIEAILELDEEALVHRVEEMDISMCGVAPTAVMLTSAKYLGATSAKMVKYQTSGDTSGDYTSVVGYAGILIL